MCVQLGTSRLAMGVLLAFVRDVEAMLWFTLLILGAARMRAWLARVRLSSGSASSWARSPSVS